MFQRVQRCFKGFEDVSRDVGDFEEASKGCPMTFPPGRGAIGGEGSGDDGSDVGGAGAGGVGGAGGAGGAGSGMKVCRTNECATLALALPLPLSLGAVCCKMMFEAAAAALKASRLFLASVTVGDKTIANGSTVVELPEAVGKAKGIGA